MSHNGAGYPGRGLGEVAAADSPAVERACAFLAEVGEMLRQKNRAYGDSAANPMRVFSRVDAAAGIRVRIDDKLSRLARGDGSGDEDAVKDLVGYLALLVGVNEGRPA